jgi:homoserine dehydrogenase
MAEGADYADALGEAQRLGFAESDPRSDVDGHDAAHKLAILAGLAFKRPSVSSALARRGIGGISREDVRAGAERGLRLKLVAVARKSAEGIEAGVTPAFVPEDHPFARPRGAENVVRVMGRGCGTLVFSGAGAGGDATASSVVADVLAALDARERGVASHEGEDLVAGPLRAPVLMRFAGGTVITTDAVPLDALEAAAGGFRGRGEVQSMIPVWRDAA